MLSRREAAECAARELARDSERHGTEILSGPGIETPGFWVFRPDSRRAFESGRATDSLASSIPPIVVDRRTGVVARPFAAGAAVDVSALGVDEWVILPPPASERGHDRADGLHLSDADLAHLAGLRHFRLRRGFRDFGDELHARVVATSPGAIEPGLESAGLVRAAGGWGFGAAERVLASVSEESASVDLWVSQSGSTETSWTISGVDVALAGRVEEALADAPWVRFWA